MPEIIDKPNWSQNTELAIITAIKAGQKTLEIFKQDFTTHFKGKEPLTEADLASNEIILQELKSTGLPILSEESQDSPERLKSELVWIVDPLDGTSHFIDKSGEFSVMLGLVKNHTPIMGVVYQPTTDILYVAEQGKGAFIKKNNNWQQLHVSQQKDLGEVQAIVSLHHLSDNERAMLDQLKIQQFKQQGSAGLKIAAIAEGTAGLYFTTTNKIKQWDSCAGYCLVMEAGGQMTDMLGKTLVYNTEDVHHKHGLLISNGLIHDVVVKAYHEFSDTPA